MRNLTSIDSRPWLTVFSVGPLLVCCAITFVNLFFSLFTFPNYADYEWIGGFIANRTTETRWLIHIKLQTAMFQTLESMFFARAFIPGFAHDPMSFARALNVLFLAIAGLHCYAFYPRFRNTTTWVISSAAYCFMATGYAKVYGSATAVLLLLYSGLEESDFNTSGVALGMIGALVSLYYLVLTPIAVAILLTLLIKRTDTFAAALLTFVLAGYVLVTIFWGQDVPGYFATLWSESHFGNGYTMYGPYRGLAASNNSIFFKLPFIFSVKHLVDKLYMLFFSGALISFAGACYEAGRFTIGPGSLLKRLKNLGPMAVFCGLSCGFYLIILIGYLSKVGPRMDLAFYAPFVVPFTFFWFQLRRERAPRDLLSKAAWIAQLTYTAVVVVWSGIIGPPPI